MKKETWILDGLILTQNETRDCFRGSIQIVDGKITDILKKSPSKISKSAKKIPAQDLFILPGFIQTHIHLCQTLFRNLADDLELLDWLEKKIWPFEAAHTKETLKVSAELGIRELLATGTTCILDMATIRHTKVVFEVAERLGIRANIGKCLMDHPKTTPTYLREDKEKALKEAVLLIKKWHGKKNDRLRASLAPRFALSCSEELLKEVARLAQKHKVLIHTHCSENKKEIEFIKKMTGLDNLNYLDKLNLTGESTVLAHCVWLSENEQSILKNTKTHVAHCPSSNLKLASGISPVEKYLKDGISVSLGADGSPCNNNLSALNEMRLASLLQKPAFGPKALNAQTALDLATRNGAKALGWWNDIGSLEIGKKADIIGINGTNIFNFSPALFDKKAHFNSDELASHITYSTHPQNCEWTMVDGKICFETKNKKHVYSKEFLGRVAKARSLILRTARSSL